MPAGPPPVAPGGGQGAVDKTVVCPAMLVGKLIGPGGNNIKKIAQDTGAQINSDSSVQPGGGKVIIITAPDPNTRERAKATIQNWIRENAGGAAGTAGIAGAGMPGGMATMGGMPGQQGMMRPPG